MIMSLYNYINIILILLLLVNSSIQLEYTITLPVSHIEPNISVILSDIDTVKSGTQLLMWFHFM